MGKIKLIIFLVFVLISGCLTTNMQTPLGIPIPWIDRKIFTYQGVLKDHNIDLRSMNHDMRNEIDAAIKANNMNNKIFNTNTPADIDQLELSNKIGIND